jgi:iron complex transport system substrate-binding protein
MPRVLYLAWHNPLKVGGRKLNTELIEKAGGIDIFSGLTGPGISKLVSLEEIISRNPQVMLGLVEHGEGKDLSYRYLMTEPRLANTEARRNNRVYPVDNDLIGRPGPRIVEGLELVARCIHPEIFQ